jgi:hypothetical protein
VKNLAARGLPDRAADRVRLYTGVVVSNFVPEFVPGLPQKFVNGLPIGLGHASGFCFIVPNAHGIGAKPAMFHKFRWRHFVDRRLKLRQGTVEVFEDDFCVRDE